MSNRIRAAVVTAGAALLAGCSATVSNPLSPQQTREQVIDSARAIVRDLGLRSDDLMEATFTYQACADNGRGPFRGQVFLGFWVPGADRSRTVDANAVTTPLQQRGWVGDPNFHTHSTALKKGDIELNIDMTSPPPGEAPNGHVMMYVLGQCRDQTDHSKDPFDPGDVKKELL